MDELSYFFYFFIPEKKNVLGYLASEENAS